MEFRPLGIAHSVTIVFSLHGHRLHNLLPMTQGITCLEVVKFFRHPGWWSARVHEFEQMSLPGLPESERSGRSRRLSEERRQGVGAGTRPADGVPDSIGPQVRRKPRAPVQPNDAG